MADLSAGDLAKLFVKAVDKSFEGNPLTQAEFMAGGTEDELLSVLGAQLGWNGEEITAEDIPADNYLYIAEVYAAIADRTGQSDSYKQFVPAEARTETGRDVLTEVAPTFAKLAL